MNINTDVHFVAENAHHGDFETFPKKSCGLDNRTGTPKILQNINSEIVKRFDSL